MNREDFGDLNLLTISDYRCIDIFELKLKGKEFVPLYGPNGSGKSTVMDSLVSVFTGGSVPEGSIRDGKDEAKITMATTKGYQIQKRIRTVQKGKNEGKQTAELVMTKDNQPVASAQTVLKDLFSGFITPNDLAKASGADLYKKVLSVSGIDTSSIDAEISKIKQAISDINAELRLLGSPAAPEGERPETVVEFDPEEYQKKLSDKAQLEANLAWFTQAHQTIAQEAEEIERLRKELEEKVSIHQQHKDKLAEKETQRAGIQKNLELVSNDITTLEQASKDQKKNAEWIKFEKDMKLIDQKKEILDSEKSKEKEAEAKKRDLIEKSPTGVDGLSLTADGKVMYKGHEWSVAAFSERMKAAAILSLKGQDKSKLQIMFIEHGESLSKAKREEIAKVAIDEGAVVFIEVMVEDTSGINDGVVMRVSDTAPVIREVAPEVVESQPVEIDLSGDLSGYSQEAILSALEKQRDKGTGEFHYEGKSATIEELKEDYPNLADAIQPAKTPEELGMKKASSIPTNNQFSFDDFLQEPSSPEPEKKEETNTDEDDPWSKPVLDIF